MLPISPTPRPRLASHNLQELYTDGATTIIHDHENYVANRIFLLLSTAIDVDLVVEFGQFSSCLLQMQNILTSSIPAEPCVDPLDPVGPLTSPKPHVFTSHRYGLVVSVLHPPTFHIADSQPLLHFSLLCVFVPVSLSDPCAELKGRISRLFLKGIPMLIFPVYARCMQILHTSSLSSSPSSFDIR